MIDHVKYVEGTVKPENLTKKPKIAITESSLANLKPRWDKEHMKMM
jgi:hypothetical protein